MKGIGSAELAANERRLAFLTPGAEPVKECSVPLRALWQERANDLQERGHALAALYLQGCINDHRDDHREYPLSELTPHERGRILLLAERSPPAVIEWNDQHQRWEDVSGCASVDFTQWNSWIRLPNSAQTEPNKPEAGES